MGRGLGKWSEVKIRFHFFAESYCSSSASEDKVSCESFWLKEFVF